MLRINTQKRHKVSIGGGTVTYEYDTNGNRKSVTYGGGVSEEYSYDRNNRLLTLTNKKPDRSVISSYSYTYDLAGRQTGKTDSFGTSSYTYDAAGRVTKAETPGKTSIYAFDRSGNRISMNETYASLQTTGFIDELSNRAVQYKVKKSQYVYTDTNRLVKLVEEMYDESSAKVLTKTVQYVYDSNGNQVSEYASYVHPSDLKLRRTIKASVYGDGQSSNPDPLIDRTLTTYDGFNRLKKVERMEAGVRTLAEYVYNGDDLRVRKTVKKSDSAYTPEVTSFLYDRQHVILEMDDSGNVTARYVRGINYIAKVAGGDETYFLYNGHGDVVQTVTAAGEVRNEYDYDIFGNPMLTIETAACSIRYAGEYLDNETGLYYLRARYYDPNIGRFISEDSYWGEDDNPLSLNLYTYAFNDPLRFIDPTGHASERIDEIIKEIDKQKSIWWAEEKGAGKGQAKWTAEQTKAHNKADTLRVELARLEQADKSAQELARLSGDDAGEWERYKLKKTLENVESNISIDEQTKQKIKQQTKDIIYAVTYGRNVAGIDSRTIENETRTIAEETAKLVVSAEVSKIDRMRNEVIAAYDSVNLLGEYAGNLSIMSQQAESIKFLGLDTVIFDSAIQSDTGNMLKLERLMLTNNAIQNNGRAFDLLLDAMADGKPLSSGTIDYLKVLLDKNPAYKRIWQEESSQRLSEALKLSASALTSSIPYIGAIKDSFETVYGSVITGNDLSTTDKALNILGAGVFKKIKALFKLTEAIDVSIDFSKLSKVERLALSEVDNMLRLERAGVDVASPSAWDDIAGLNGDVGKVLDKGTSKSVNIGAPKLVEGSQWERNVLNSFEGGKAVEKTYGGGTKLYRIGDKNGGFWTTDAPPATEYEWRVKTAIKQEWGNNASNLYEMTIPEGSSITGLGGKVGPQGMGLYGGGHQVYIDYNAVPVSWITVTKLK